MQSALPNVIDSPRRKGKSRRKQAMKQTMRASVVATGNKLQVKTGSRGFEITFDEPEDSGGGNTGMNPVEGLLCALGACNTIATLIFAGASKTGIDSLEVDLEGDIDPDGFMGLNPNARNGFEEIRISVNAKGPDASALREVIDQAERQCPVSDTVKNPVPVIVTSVRVSD